MEDIEIPSDIEIPPNNGVIIHNLRYNLDTITNLNMGTGRSNPNTKEKA